MNIRKPTDYTTMFAALDAECGDFRGMRQQRRTGVVRPSRTTFWMEKSEIIGINQNAGMAKFFSRRASDFLLYW